MSDVDKNKRLVTEFYETAFVQQRQVEAADRYFGDRYIQHNPFVSDGADGFKRFFTETMPSSPDVKYKILRVIAGDDLVAVHATINRGEGPGTVLVDMFRVENDKIVEHWDVYMPIPDPAAIPHNNGIF
ncbi:MAG: nuclear transport factor 2 family protein [Acidimicrobiales bacterium]